MGELGQRGLTKLDAAQEGMKAIGTTALLQIITGFECGDDLDYESNATTPR
jgi:hypothetical protein